MAQRNPPLTGKPPFATDEPDSAFPENKSTRRYRQNLSPADANSRSSAYDVYDNYLDNSNRNSGIGALGMGFMNADMDDDDDDDDDDIFIPVQKQKQSAATARSPPTTTTAAPASVAVATLVSASAAPAAAKALDNAAVPAVAAAAPPSRSHTGPIRVPPSPTPPGPAPPVESHPQLHQAAIPLAAPRPGYAAPIAALNLAHPPSTVSPAIRASPTGITVQVPPPGIPITSIGTPVQSVPSTPHPLLPPMTPITPAFARPPKSPAPRETVKFAKPEPIMRSDSEDVLLPKRGERGDDFWRRFSTIAKEENKKSPLMKESPWLRKNQSGSTRMSRWVWAAAIIILLCIAGGVAAIVISTHGKSSQQPKALGGSANETSSSIPTKSTATNRLPGTGRPQITPTHTVARRDGSSPTATSIHIHRRQLPDHPRYHRRRLGDTLSV